MDCKKAQQGRRERLLTPSHASLVLREELIWNDNKETKANTNFSSSLRGEGKKRATWQDSGQVSDTSPSTTVTQTGTETK